METIRIGLISYYNMLQVTPTIAIDDAEVQIEAIRASGPGGQNVNKVSSAVQLRFDARNSPNLPPGVRERLLRLAGRRATSEGVIMLRAQQNRRQDRNREDAIERLLDMIREAAVIPKTRRATKPTRASRRRRVEAKKRRGEIKGNRGSVSGEE